MGILDNIKRKIKQGDDDLDELDTDSDSGEDDGDAPSASSGGGALGRAAGLLNRVKNLSSDGEGDEGGGIGALLGKAKGLGRGNQNSGDSDLDDDDTALDELDTPDADQDDEDGEPPIKRSGIAAKLDGDPEAAEPSNEEDDDGEAEAPVPAAVGAGSLDLASLFEEESVINPALKDLAESLDDVSAVELAADLRTFLVDLQ